MLLRDSNLKLYQTINWVVFLLLNKDCHLLSFKSACFLIDKANCFSLKNFTPPDSFKKNMFAFVNEDK